MATTELVALLTRASNAYYNGQEPIIDDETFDAMVEKLQILDPDNPFLTTVGASPLSEGSIQIPYTMPSLEKIKPGQDGLKRFLAKSASFVLSEKLDGLSALWLSNTGALYLRGDGRIGQTVTPHAKKIQGLIHTKVPCVVRGELILPRAVVIGQGARAIVNGLIHQKQPDPVKLAQIHFVAYEVVSPNRLTRKEQFEWLLTHGFEVPWWSAAAGLTEEICSKYFEERRQVSPYETDGIVVGIDQIPEKIHDSVKPPKDCVAFKMVVADQSAVTTVRAVLWAASAQGYLIPRLQFDPVTINGAKIEFCTGHNARNIVEQQIGPGAMIRIRRSGDVIPTLDKVILPAKASFPEDVSSWIWITGDNPTHICTKTKTTEQTVSQLLHFAKTIEIPGLGPANCRALVEGDICSPATLWRASEETLCKLLGSKSGATLYKSLRKLLAASVVSELQLLLASSKLPRGTGEAKLKTLLQSHPDPTTWRTAGLVIPSGWTATTFQEFQESFSEYEAWRQTETFWIPYPILQTMAGGTVPPSKGRICMTGFRNKELEQKIRQKGYEIVPTMSSTVTILIVADGGLESPSEKVKKGQMMGAIEILECSEFNKKYMC